MIRKLVDTPRRVLAGVTVLLVLAAGAWSVQVSGNHRQLVPPEVQGQFSAARAVTHLERFATEPRPLGSPAGDRAADYIAGQLRATGFAVEVQHAVGGGAGKGLASFGRVDNVIATLPGRDSTGTVLLAAHYDSAATGPGASDDGAAVAAMLETGRLIARDGRPRNDLVLLFTDGEEDGLLGAEAFVREHPLGRAGGVVLNWEARGVSGPSLMFETSSGNAELVSLFTEVVPDPRGDSSMVEFYRKLPNDTDFSEFSAGGFTGLNFAYIEEASYYHTAGDSLANLDPRSLQHHGDTMVALTRALGAADLPALRSEQDATYFRLGVWTITYSNMFALPAALLGAVLVAAVAVLAWRRGTASARQLAGAAVSAALPVAAAVAAGQALWRLLVLLRPGYELMGGLLHRPLFYQAAVAALVVAGLLVWYPVSRRRVGPAALVAGALAWPAVLGVGSAVLAPGASFLFSVPTVFAAAGALLASAPVRRIGWTIAASVLGLSVSVLLYPGLTRLLFDGIGLAYAGAPAFFLTLFGFLLLPAAELLLPGRTPRGKVVWAAPSIVVLLALVSIGAGLVTDTADAEHPRRSHLAYVLDADTGQAHWVSSEEHPTAWTRGYVTGHDISGLPPGYARGALWTGRAEPIRAEGPRLEVRHRDGDTVTVHVVSRRAATGLTLRVDHPIDLVSVSAAGSAPVTVEVDGVRARTWPGEIRFRDLPPEGVDITMRTPGADRIRVTVIDETRDIADAPGFRARPDHTVASTREDGDLIAVARTYEM
ncbi:M28 family peptidase [Nocardia sp. X0981]